MRWRSNWAIGALALAVWALAGCGGAGGGSGGGAEADGVVMAVSYAGFTTQPSGQGPNGSAPLPAVFRDEVVTITFDGPIDGEIFGGFAVDAETGNPVVMDGRSAGASAVGETVPYQPYQDQGLAASSIELRSNALGASVVASYIVGRHASRPEVLVLDPWVQGDNALGLPFAGGFVPGTEYTWRIPSTTALTIAGQQARPLGQDPLSLPIVVPAFTPTPELGMVFRVIDAVAPDPFPPTVVSIEPASGAAATLEQPMASDDTLRVRFSRPIDLTTIRLLENVMCRNRSLTTAAFPEGVPVAVVFGLAPESPDELTLMPVGSWGPGENGLGYEIEVRIGTFGDPSLPGILGLPQGSPTVQLEMVGSSTRTLRAVDCAACEETFASIETFTTTAQQDPFYVPTFNSCLWGGDTEDRGIEGVAISGNPLATFAGGPGNLGTRVQVTSPIGPGTTLPLTTVPFSGLFAPFDSVASNIGVNPAGGSQVMHLFESVDFGGVSDALELIEWGPTGNTVVASTYPAFETWVGLTDRAAPAVCPAVGAAAGLLPLFATNYRVSTRQTPDAGNLNPLPGFTEIGGVLARASAPYTTVNTFAAYYPFPVFDVPFDYVGSGAASANMIIEMNVEPGGQIANLTRFRSGGTAGAAPRRLLGGPRGAGIAAAAAAGCDIYDLRFTFVSLESSARSLYYDSLVPQGLTAEYRAFELLPRPQAQPAGTASRWELEGATALVSPGQAAGPTTGFLTWWDGGPETGIENPLVLDNPGDPSAPQVSGNRFYRFRATLRNNHLTNARPRYVSLMVAAVGTITP